MPVRRRNAVDSIICTCLMALLAIFCGIELLMPKILFGQMDQGTITGVVEDTSGAIVPHAPVTLTSTDTGLVLKTKSDSKGIYTFSPIKIGGYSVSASAPGFNTTTQEHLHLDLQQSLNVVLTLKPGEVSTSVTVSTAPPLLQTQSAAVGQVLSTQTINNMPVNGRNAVYVAQLTAGVVRGVNGRGANEGDFDANGQRAQQNNFILDGIDNNSYVPAFSNQAGFVVNPPPDALAEFNVQTSNYSAELGHSAGAVLNTSVKSGTNQIHGSLWEYLRNTDFDAKDWNTTQTSAYHENQFGATLGAPILHNRLFFFGYAEADRIAYADPIGPITVPTALMRKGDFSELLNASLTSSGRAIKLYQPNVAGSPVLACGVQANVICPGDVDPIAQKILSLYPMPNTNGAKAYNNYTANLSATQNSWQWGARLDWNISSKDQAFSRFSYVNLHVGPPHPLGPILDGGLANTESQANVDKNLVFSETHLFNSNLINEFRFGYSAGSLTLSQVNFHSPGVAASLGLGGIPSGGVIGGALPTTAITGIAGFGTPITTPQQKNQKVFEFLDNVTKIHGNHSLKVGLLLQKTYIPFFSPPSAFGKFGYSGTYTSSPGVASTGFGAADFLLDQMNSASISNYRFLHFSHWTRGAYFQDDWRITNRLTLNLGLRYDNFQPMKEDDGEFATIDVQPNGPSKGTGTLTYTKSQQGTYLAPKFLQYLTNNNVALQYSDNSTLVNGQSLNFSPRVGFAYSFNGKSVVRGGFGMFFSGTENVGGNETLQNYPFQNSSTFSAAGCSVGKCVPIAITLESGFTSVLSGNGLVANVTSPTFSGSQPTITSPYTEAYNLAYQRAISNNLVATVAYVGNVSRHLIVHIDRNSPMALIDPRSSSKTVQPFYNVAGGNAASLGTIGTNEYAGMSNYNSLQTTLEKRYGSGLSFLATYTWSHSLDDASQPLSGNGYRAPNIIGINNDYATSNFDVRHRMTLNAYYQLPVGVGRKFLAGGGILDAFVGGWAADLQFTAQTGLPFTVDTNLGSAGPNGGTAETIRIRDPFAPGGTPDPSNPALKSCPTATRTKANWYNPCAFANPPLAFPNAGTPGSPISTTQIAGLAALPYLGGRFDTVYGPGYERVNLSLFKRFHTFREQYIEFRADIFNVLNTPSLANPSNTTNNATGGQITEPQTSQNFTPDARFFQLSAKYVF